jgi:hypothetical protein
MICAVQPSLEEKSASPFAQITSNNAAIPLFTRGVSRSSRTWRGMRWTLMVPMTTVLEADGEVVWS